MKLFLLFYKLQHNAQFERNGTQLQIEIKNEEMKPE